MRQSVGMKKSSAKLNEDSERVFVSVEVKPANRRDRRSFLARNF
jgi:hypothetical protein